MTDVEEGRTRLTLDLSPRYTRILNDSIRRRGVTKAEALRKACNLLFAFDQAKDEGMTVGAFGQIGGVPIYREFIY